MSSDRRATSAARSATSEPAAPTAIPYRQRGLLARYIPDFIVVTDRDENVIVEIKGQVTDDADAKAAERWVEAVNRLGGHGVWRYLLVEDPGRLGIQLNEFTSSKWDEGPFQLT